MNINGRLPQGILLLGCGKMGSAMLQGWLAEGLEPNRIWVIEPKPSNWLKETGAQLNKKFPVDINLVLIAVKPQVVKTALAQLIEFYNEGTIFLSVAAGVSLATYEGILGSSIPIVRAMPNTPAAIGEGISALIGNDAVNQRSMTLCETLLSAIGQTIRLNNESHMDAVTGLSGSGPAYVFLMIDALTAAGCKQGLPEELAALLAKATVAGAGSMAMQSKDTPEQLRKDVTSPNGTTQAGLKVLLDESSGLIPLITETVSRAVNRSKELSNG